MPSASNSVARSLRAAGLAASGEAARTGAADLGCRSSRRSSSPLREGGGEPLRHLDAPPRMLATHESFLDRTGSHAAVAAQAAGEAGLRYVSDSDAGAATRARRATASCIEGRRQPRRRRGDAARIRALAIPPAWTDVWICPKSARPPAGDRPRRARPQAVPLPRAVERRARRRQVRSRDRVRRGAAAAAPTPAARPQGARTPAREGAGDRRRGAGRNPDPRRQPGVRAQQPLVRADDAAQPPRRIRARRSRTVPFPRQGRAGARRRARRCAPGAAGAPLPAAAGPGAVPVPRRRRQRGAGGSGDVNDYLRDATGDAFTAKDFRTWGGTLAAFQRAVARRGTIGAVRQRGAGEALECRQRAAPGAEILRGEIRAGRARAGSR